jgi:hypothetical protein
MEGVCSEFPLLFAIVAASIILFSMPINRLPPYLPAGIRSLRAPSGETWAFRFKSQIEGPMCEAGGAR